MYRTTLKLQFCISSKTCESLFVSCRIERQARNAPYLLPALFRFARPTANFSSISARFCCASARSDES